MNGGDANIYQRHQQLYKEIRDRLSDVIPRASMPSVEGAADTGAVACRVAIRDMTINVQMDGGDYLASTDGGRWYRSESMEAAVLASLAARCDQLRSRLRNAEAAAGAIVDTTGGATDE